MRTIKYEIIDDASSATFYCRENTIVTNCIDCELQMVKKLLKRHIIFTYWEAVDKGIFNMNPVEEVKIVSDTLWQALRIIHETYCAPGNISCGICAEITAGRENYIFHKIIHPYANRPFEFHHSLSKE